MFFNLMTLDGYVAGQGGDISWHQRAVDKEFQTFAEKSSNAGSTLLFGRITYQLMAAYWPTPAAVEGDPVVAQGMNRASKIVFSRTLERADWTNTRLIKSDMIGAVRRLKRKAGKGLTILGSATITAQLAEAGLIDRYQLLVAPVAIGAGKTMFEGLKKPLALKLAQTRAFRNGSVLLTYERGKN